MAGLRQLVASHVLIYSYSVVACSSRLPIEYLISQQYRQDRLVPHGRTFTLDGVVAVAQHQWLAEGFERVAVPL